MASFWLVPGDNPLRDRALPDPYLPFKTESEHHACHIDLQPDRGTFDPAKPALAGATLVLFDSAFV